MKLFFKWVVLAALSALVLVSSSSNLPVLVVNQQNSSDVVAQSREIYDLRPEKAAEQVVLAQEITEQDRVDTIIRAFKHLPPNELARIPVNIDVPVLAGTVEAEALKLAWNQRQEEFKAAVDSLMKPAEFMAQQAQIIKENYASTNEEARDEVSKALNELEGLLEDVDNARDFHTIGGWPVLLRLLHSDVHWSHRMNAAWALGSAVKNNYDFQLWILESLNTRSSESTDGTIPDRPGKVNIPHDDKVHLLDAIESGKSGLELLLNMLGDFEDDIRLHVDEFHRRALYGLSSSLRGNVDVQQAAHMLADPSTGKNLLTSSLWRLMSRNSTSVDVRRKVWTLASDLLDEVRYVFEDLQAMADLTHAQREEVLQVAQGLIGPSFCVESWMLQAVRAVTQAVQHPGFTRTVCPSTTTTTTGTTTATTTTAAKDRPVLRALLGDALHVLQDQFSLCPKVFDTHPEIKASVEQILQLQMNDAEFPCEQVQRAIPDLSRGIKGIEFKA